MRLLVGLGGNLGDVDGSFRAVCAALRSRGCLVSVSGMYRSRPLGPPQADYTNAAILVDLNEPITHFLSYCQAQEASAGRDRKRERKWGPRTLDLDLLMTPDVVCRGPELELPHPRFADRAFALVPAAELCPDWMHPIVGRSLADLAREVVARDCDAVCRLDEVIS